MWALLELQQEAVFSLSALLTCERCGEGEKEKYIQRIALFVSPPMGVPSVF